MMSSLRASPQGLVTVDRARRRKGWTKTWTAAWWEAAHTSQATLRRFWRGLAIQRENFIAICQVVGLEDWEAIAADSTLDLPPENAAESAESSNELFPQTSVEWQEAAEGVETEAPELPEGSVKLNSPFYVERSPIESRCYGAIAKAGALIRIRAPRQMGKTSLLDRILDRANQKGYRTVRLNLLQAEVAVFSDLDKFLRWFCLYISRKLQLDDSLNQYWERDWGSILNCTAYFQDQVLETVNTPICLALDECDRIFQFPDVTQGFFPMLRSWHEEAKTVEIWENLRLVVVHSTEPYGALDINRSPFNVGLPVELTEFTATQVHDLVKRYQLDWSNAQVEELMVMIGGHPYLIRLALYHLACGDLRLPELLREAPTDAGIYEDHLRRHWTTLKMHPELADAFHAVITTPDPVRIETLQAYKLHSMGLIKRQGDFVIPRCQLYQQYFRERLPYSHFP
jgi:AAA-like domain